MKNILLFLVIFFPVSLFAQDCDCESNFNWVKKTFEENDAGVSYVFESKSQEEYETHNATFRAKIKGISDEVECLQTLYSWLTFFRDGHIGIIPNNAPSDAEVDQKTNEAEIRKLFAEWVQFPIDQAQLEKDLMQGHEDIYEGIYYSAPYKIAIKKVGSEYIGSILEADGVYWTKDQVKLKINADKSVVYYMQDHSPREFDRVELIGKNYLKMGFITLSRIFPEYPIAPKVAAYFKAMNTNTPYFEQLNPQTTYLRIPTFSGTEKRTIDSVILANRERILSSANFIIDIRNNGGGSDRSYNELLPIVYTNPMRSVGMEFLSTPLNNQRMLDFVNIPEYDFTEEEKKEAQIAYDTLSKYLGQFVNLDSIKVHTTVFDTIYPYPSNVAILINENCGSTSEQFLLDTKQSKKVKLYGKTTAGVLDISNMQFVDSPCQEFQLGYCLSRSYRIPDMAIDGKGVQPDYYLDDEISDADWVDHVLKILNE